MDGNWHSAGEGVNPHTVVDVVGIELMVISGALEVEHR
jgi:hypothetical protein